ncbi:MAG TPA: mandelate racemase/muconate lactonizing enzyme family protein [Chloroflexota bacterium]|nr:mandelate racemase/muconate lactonizing enzyme family protein [Chloroflexota bacterium]
MKITAVRVVQVTKGTFPWTMVEVQTDAGLIGLGEGTLESRPGTLAAAIREAGRVLIGQDPADIERLFRQMYHSPFWRGGPVLMSAIAALDHALWDINAQAVGVPVWKLLGGRTRDRVRAYSTGVGGPCKTPEELAERAQATAAKGFTAFKIDPWVMANGGPPPAWPDPALHRRAMAFVAAAREAVGWDVDIAIECHGWFAPAKAIEYAHDLAPFKPLFMEEPVPPESFDALGQVAHASPVPIATGERVHTKFAARDLLQRGGAAVWQCDITHAGGFTEMRKIAAIAETGYVQMAPHNPYGPVATIVNAHFDTAIPNFLAQETLGHDPAWRRDLVEPPVEVVDGHLEVSDRPGLGIRLVEKTVAQYAWSETVDT